MKPNDSPLYVNKNSNHPKGILENIPHSVNRRLSMISSNKEVFDLASPPYQDALRKSGYDYTLHFDPPVNSQKSNNRQRNISYFNPPFSKNVKTNIGRQFLKLLDKNFPHGHPLRPIMNRNTVKISYRCLANMKKKISSHNLKVQKSEEVQPEPGCNCSGVMGPCPLEGKCLVESVVYRAEVKDGNNNLETYTGLTAGTFKKRYYSHRRSFQKRDSEHATTLSSHIWNLQDKNENFEVKWKIIDRGKDFNPINRKCGLCIKEKYHIIFQPEGASLNQRSELFSTCRHRKKKLLANT